MTTRETSRAAFDALVAGGKLKGKQRQVLDELIKLGSATSGEVLAALNIHNVNAWRARFTELAGRGLIADRGERKCRISGLRCVLWVPTGRAKPLHVTKGAREPINGRAWKEMAEQLASALESVLVVTDATGLLDGSNGRRALKDHQRMQVSYSKALNGQK